MNIPSAKNLLVVFFVGIFFFSSCRKDPSSPAIKPFATGPSITIEQLRSMWTGMNIKFTSNTILYGVVTADETSGQLYKEVYIRDNSGTFATTNHYGAIVLRFLSSSNGALYQGDSIGVNLNGATLDMSTGGSLQVDSIFSAHYPNVHVIKSGLNPQPLIATLPQLNTFMGGRFIFDGQLVQLNNVEFVPLNLGSTYAIPQSYSVNITSVPPQNINRYVCDAAGNTIVAYNSGYANFAGQVIPQSSGTITAISNLYTTMQLSIRSFQDANLNAPYLPIVYDQITQDFTCAGLYSKTQVYTAGWKTFDLKGNLFWQGLEWGNYPNYRFNPSVSNYTKASNATPRNDIWLISPPILDARYAYGAGYSKKIDFSSALQYGTADRLLSVWVSNLYDGTHLIPSQWQDISPFFPQIPPTLSVSSQNGYLNLHYTTNGGFSPTPVNISVGSTTQYFYIAFRYQSSTNPAYPDSSGSTYALGTLVLKN